MNIDPTLQNHFLRDACIIIEKLGSTDDKMLARAEEAWGLSSKDAKCYRDKVVEIIVEGGKSKAKVIAKASNGLLILSLNREGTVRWWAPDPKIVAHVMGLASRLLTES